MTRVAQAPSRYEVELRRTVSGDGETDATWRPARLVRPRTFATLAAARAHAERLRPEEARVVAVEPGGRRRTVDAEGT
jgi:hypothetical protein